MPHYVKYLGTAFDSTFWQFHIRTFSAKAFTHDVFICFLKVFVNTLYLNYNLTLCVNSHSANADCFIKSKCFCILFYTQFSNARPCLFNFFLPTLEKEILFVVFAGIKKCVCALAGFYFTFFMLALTGLMICSFFLIKKNKKIRETIKLTHFLSLLSIF